MPARQCAHVHLGRLALAVSLTFMCVGWMGCGPGAEARTPQLVAVAQGNGTVVAVGSRAPIHTAEDEPSAKNALAAVSDDGQDWRAVQINDQGALEDVAFGGGTFVAVGGYTAPSSGIASLKETRILTSTDGEQWTRQSTQPDDVFLGSVAYGNGTFVALGPGAVFRSTDGVSWEHQEAGNLIGATVDFIDGQFVAWGTGRSMWRSTDGTSWTEQKIDDVRDVWHVVRANNQWFATAVNSIGAPDEADPDEPLFLHSSDGLQWEIHRPFSGALPRDMAYGDGEYVAVFSKQAPMVSSDGLSWRATQATNPHGLAVVFANGSFISVGPQGVWTSANGDTWTQRLESQAF